MIVPICHDILCYKLSQKTSVYMTIVYTKYIPL